MDLLENIKNICNKSGIIPARSKGQNFLIDEDVYNRIIDNAGINKDDTVLEAGPGLGILTEKLAQKVKKVVAVELDDKLANFLNIKFANYKNVEIINGDILDLRIKIYDLRAKDNNGEYLENKILNSSFVNLESCYNIVANLPYNITSVFLKNFLTSNPPQSMTLMLQKEVAERIIAQPPEMSILSFSVQYYADPKILFYVSRDKFWPQPEVDSAVVRIDLKPDLVRDVDKEKDLFRLVKVGFSSRRKMLKNNLMSGYKISQEIAKNRLKKAGIDEKARAQELSLAEWEKLFVEFS